MLKQDSWGQK